MPPHFYFGGLSMRRLCVLVVSLLCLVGFSRGEVWVEKNTGIEFVKVKGGCFIKGCVKGDSSCYFDEKPSQKVCVKDFWISRYEVTLGQWKRFVEETHYKPAKKDLWGCVDVGKPMFEQDDRHPVVCVNWYDAEAFAKWLSKKTGLKFRLPTEAEWEYACKKGGGLYSCGDSVNGNLANYWSGFAGRSGKDIYKFTSPVGTFPADNLGIYDLSGNVWEWVRDWYSVPGLPEKKEKKVVKGGGWSDKAKFLRCSARRGLFPYRNYDTVGFRLVLERD